MGNRRRGVVDCTGCPCPDDPTYPAALVTRSLYPLVRAVDHPELVIRNAPIITIT